MERGTAFTDLPLEVHHEIGSYLLPVELKALSLVSWQFFDWFSYPLAKVTVTRLDKYLEKTEDGYIPLENPPLRKLLCNIRMHCSMFEAAQKLAIDRDYVRDVQIILDMEFTGKIFDAFPKLHSLRFLNMQEHIELNPDGKTLVLPKNVSNIKKALENLRNFTNIQFTIDDVLRMKTVLLNNSSTLLRLKIREDYKHRDLANTIPNGLRLQKLTIESQGGLENSHFSFLPIFETSTEFHLNMNFDMSFDRYYINMFPYVTHLRFTFNDSSTSARLFLDGHLEKKWQLPRLQVFESNYCGKQYLDNIEAPNLRKLVLRNLYNTSTIDCLKRFQTVKELRASSHKPSFLKTATEFFTQNFRNLVTLEMEQEGNLDDFQVQVVLNTITKFKLSPISKHFKCLKISGKYLQEEHELAGFNLEGYEKTTYPHVKKWEAEIDGIKVEIVFEVAAHDEFTELNY